MKKSETISEPTKLAPARSPFWLRAIGWIVTLGLLVVAAIAIYVVIVFLQMPSLDAILRQTREPSITFVDSAGYEIRSANKIMETPVDVKTLPPYIPGAILAIEDKRFYDHGPVDFWAMARAAVTNIVRGGTVQGGSTITQQVAKNIFLSRAKTMTRKVQEIIISYWLENRFTKNQILNLYMNRVQLVPGMRGIDAAARNLFRKTTDALSVAEAAQLAAMLKAPTTYSPLLHPDKNIARARIVLAEMVRQKYITLPAAQDAARNLFAVTPAPDTNIYRYWTDFVTEEIRTRIGTPADDLIVFTTIDSDLQTAASAAIRSGVANATAKNVGQGAAIVLSRDGAIRAMVGGTDYVASQYNRTLALRQPGSTFKPATYLVALSGGMTPNDIVTDAPFTIGDYSPNNYNGKFYGDITLSTAFAKSANSVPLRLTQIFGIDAVIKMARKLGVTATLRREYSTVLGASEVTLLDLCTMYNTIFNVGVPAVPYAIDKIVTPDGRVLYERNADTSPAVISDIADNEMLQLLADVLAPGGTGGRAVAPNVIGGKTGTSGDYRDAWFVGATDTAGADGGLTIGVWVGNDDFTPMKNITGGTIPADIFHNIVTGSS